MFLHLFKTDWILSLSLYVFKEVRLPKKTNIYVKRDRFAPKNHASRSIKVVQRDDPKGF